MKKCDYGCDREAKHVFQNGKSCCSLHYRSCPFQANKIGKTRIGKKHTEVAKQKIGKKTRKRIQDRGGAYFKGRTHTDEAKQKISEKNKGKTRNDNFVQWNKGLTKYDNDKIASGDQVRHAGSDNGMYGKKHTDEAKQKISEKNIEQGKWKGKNNPWYGKDRSKENSPRFLSEKERTKWKIYEQKARMLTERTYKGSSDEINPNNYIRGLTEYHLDHIIPIWYGFINNITPDILAKKGNLRMLFYLDNIRRNKIKLSEEEQEILLHLSQV